MRHGLHRRSIGAIAALVLLGLSIMSGGLLAGRWASDYILDNDARAIATQWSNLLMQQFFQANGVTQDEERGTNVEMISPQLLAAFQNGAGDLDLAGEAAAGQAADADLFHRGRYISHIYRYAIFGRSGAVFAKSQRFTDAQDLNVANHAAGHDAFERAVQQGKQTVLDLDDQTSRVFVPINTGRTVSYVVAVDVDQSAAGTLLSGAMNLVMLLTGLLMAVGIGLPTLLFMRQAWQTAKVESDLRFVTQHDVLTGLPNRSQLGDYFPKALARAARRGHPVAMLCLDLDHFGAINDAFGHENGNKLLQRAAMRLREAAREGDFVARIIGDEFAVVADCQDLPHDVVALASRLCQACALPYELDGQELTFPASIGIAIAPIDGTDLDTLQTNAHSALERAKSEGRNRFCFFKQEMDAAFQKRSEIEHALRAALKGNQLQVHYQPQFSISDGSVTGYEALLRWRHPKFGQIPPAIFIPIAEQSDLIAILSEWVLRTAAAYAASWPEAHYVAVNLSPAQWKYHDVVAVVRNVLDETGLAPERLELEITESLLAKDTEAAIKTLNELDGLGVRIAMDDFGTGYSSLSHLTRFPVRKIRIDRSFVTSLGENDHSIAIVSTIIRLGRSLKITVTAEGVETEDQLRVLRRYGCNQLQGYLWGRPGPTVLQALASPAANGVDKIASRAV